MAQERLAARLAAAEPYVLPPALAAQQNPADNYAGGFRNPDGSRRNSARTVTNRRRTRSEFRIVFQPNIVHHSEAEAQQLGALYTEVADILFQRPDILREAIYAIDLPDGYQSRVYSGGPMHGARLFATAGDRYDAAHVFEHFYASWTERGDLLDRVHMNVELNVLHDSLFRVNTRLMGMIFKLLLNKEIRRRGLPERWLRPVDSVGVFCTVQIAKNGGDYGKEYDVKDQPEWRGAFTRRRPNATRGGQAAVRIRRPIVSANLPVTPPSL